MGEIPGIVFNCENNQKLNSSPELSVSYCKLLAISFEVQLMNKSLNLGQQIKMNPSSHLLSAFGGVIATSLLVVITLGRVIKFLHESI